MMRYIAFIIVGLFMLACHDFSLKAPDDAGGTGGSGGTSGSGGIGGSGEDGAGDAEGVGRVGRTEPGADASGDAATQAGCPEDNPVNCGSYCCPSEYPVCGGCGFDCCAKDVSETGGQGGSGGAGGTGGGGDCENIQVDADIRIVEQNGNVLVVFDRSLTMNSDWNGQLQYEAAGNALIDSITPLQDQLTVGGVFFPSGAIVCVVNDITASDQINFMPAAQFIAALPDHWFLDGIGFTPIEAAIQTADSALSSANFSGNTVVVMMTDGEPNCGDNMDNANAIVAGWAAKGIKTYVVGLPGSSGADAILARLAQSGGTNNYIGPDDPASLQDALSGIVAQIAKAGIASCVTNLVKTSSSDIDKLQMIVTKDSQEYSVPRQLANGGGWTVSSDGKVATMQGALCDDAKNGRFESIRFVSGCVDMPLLP
jgi:hypothetical protein